MHSATESNSRVKINAQVFEQMATSVRIRDQDGEGLVPFRLNQEQRIVARAAEKYPWVYVLKARQVGLTTFWLLWDVLWVMAHDSIGKPVRCILLWDNEENVKSKVALCRWFCDELGIDVEPFSMRIKFPGGSEILGITAGGRSPGRGLDGADRIHASEMPYWLGGRETWQGVMALVNTNKSVTIETTMHMREKLAARLWSEPNDFHKVFLKVSDHKSYRADHRVKDLRQDELEVLKQEGFNVDDPEELSAGAWWLNKLKVDCEGDWTLLKRDYPQMAEHAFAVAEGRWVDRDPAILDPIDVITTVGADGHRFKTEIFRHPEDVRGKLLIGVDTSKGVGLDHSVVLAYDTADGAICASFNSNRVLYDDLARVAKEVYEWFTIAPFAYSERDDSDRKPTIIVETNGVGKNTSLAMDRAGLDHISMNTQRAEKYRAMRHAKRAIERGEAYGPQFLFDNVVGCFYEGSDFKGEKDLLMAYGFCALYHEEEGGTPDWSLVVNDPYEPKTFRKRKHRKRNSMF